MASEQDRQHHEDRHDSSRRHQSRHHHHDHHHSSSSKTSQPIVDEDYIDWDTQGRITKVDDGIRKRNVVLVLSFVVLVFLFVAFDIIIKKGNRVILVGDVAAKKTQKAESKKPQTPAPDKPAKPAENTVASTTPPTKENKSTPADDETGDDLVIPPFDDDEPLINDDSTPTVADDETVPDDEDAFPDIEDDDLFADDDKLDPNADDQTIAENDETTSDAENDDPFANDDGLEINANDQTVAANDDPFASDDGLEINADDQTVAVNDDPSANDVGLEINADDQTIAVNDGAPSDVDTDDVFAGGDDLVADVNDASLPEIDTTVPDSETDDLFAGGAPVVPSPGLETVPDVAEPTIGGENSTITGGDASQTVAVGDPSSNEVGLPDDVESGALAISGAPQPGVSNSLADDFSGDDEPLSPLPASDDASTTPSETTTVANNDASGVASDNTLPPDDALPELGDSESLDPEIVVFSDENETDDSESVAPEKPVIDLEQSRAELAQLEFQFRQVMNDGERDVDDVLDALDPPLAQTRDFVEKAPDELVKPANALLENIEGVYSDLARNLDFFHRLESLDAASLNGKEARAFFAPWRQDVKPENASKPSVAQSERVASYEKDFARAVESLDALDVVDKWNAFMQENGERLELFHVTQDDAKLGLNFISEFRVKPGVPEEIKSVEKREPQWRFEASREFPTQRKIVLMLEDELKQKYWTYSPSRDRFYYLPSAPRQGENNYVARADGALAKVTIPADAPELKVEVSPQKQILIDLEKMARDIPDSLRNDDVAQWYQKWSAFLQKLQETKNLDPIMQYKFFQQAALYLQSSDYYFSSRLEPLLRVLNAPQLDENSLLDRFQTETSDLRALRSLAISRVDFLPQGHLKVDKTTEELNAGVERFATLYRRVGWLDKGLNGEWRLRKPKDVQTPAGDLYVLYAETQGVEPRWFKIGSSDGRQVTLNVASESIPRGSIVLCRIPLTRASTVATRSSVDALFTR